MPPIPETITPEQFMEIRIHLNNILTDIEACQVAMRLNESRRGVAANYENELGDGDPFFNFSFFVGSVQDDTTIAQRRHMRILDPGLFRFGDNATSKEAREAAKRTVDGKPLAELFSVRNWPDVPPPSPTSSDYQKKGMGSKGMGRESGLVYQKYIGICVNTATGRRCVGTLGVGFRVKPVPETLHDSRIRDWAQGTPSAAAPGTLLQHLLNTFNGPGDLWGPISP